MFNARHVWETFLNILFPAICLACNQTLPGATRGRHLCSLCVAGITIATAACCLQCDSRLPANKKHCHPKIPLILSAATRYEDAGIQKLIWRLKYQKTRIAAIPLAGLMIAHLEATALPVKQYVIIPVPLHPSRRRERGFNQAELIAKIISAYYNRPLISTGLIRTRPTDYQAHLHGQYARLKNVADAFAARDRHLIRGKNIILVDDVATTGATLHAAARKLKDAGAHKIIGLVAAKA